MISLVPTPVIEHGGKNRDGKNHGGGVEKISALGYEKRRALSLSPRVQLEKEIMKIKSKKFQKRELRM